MRLPKHKLPKGKPQHGKKAARTNKHKAHNPKRKADDSASVEMSVSDNDNEDETSKGQDEGSVASFAPLSAATPNAMSKEDRERVRAERHKRNAKKNQYKVRNGNCTGKHGPRAINRGTMS